MTQKQFDRLTQYLISNGDVPAVSSQRIYEYAWSEGIRPLRERDLKPEDPLRKEPSEKRPGPKGRKVSCRGFSILRAMKREVRDLSVEMVMDRLGRRGGEDF